MKKHEQNSPRPLIKNYGLFWKRDQVFWEGEKGNKGSLMGRVGQKGKIIDFREQQGVYALYDSSFNLIYVGQTGKGNDKLFHRLKTHHRAGHLGVRWSLFSWFGVISVAEGKNRLRQISEGKTKAATTSMERAVNHLEAILIAVSEPPLNRQGGSFGVGVKRYLQHIDLENVYPDEKTMTQEMYTKYIEEEDSN